MIIINDQTVRRMLLKKEMRSPRIGWVDYSRGSWDWRVAEARLCRIAARVQGVRLTYQQALREFI